MGQFVLRKSKSRAIGHGFAGALIRMSGIIIGIIEPVDQLGKRIVVNQGSQSF